MIGNKLGPYEITAPLGEGGMGQVYRAHDTTLDRDVAIKVLPEDFSDDANRLARFEREAKLLASLNHPNIATIFGFEESDGVRFIAMELVEGQSLAERIEASGRIEVDEALEIARRIALALEAAHEAGVIHRDLKPANVQVAPDGTVKVLDFGLAKAYEAEGSDPSSDLSHSPTMMAATGTGVIMGTAPYMSPEQARGKPVDKRSDIWSFGCVLYEMLAGKRAFDGETVSDTMAAIIRAEPDWGAVPEATPAIVRHVMRRCLEKDPQRRLRDVGDARIELEDTQAQPPGDLVPQAATKGRQIPAVVPWALAILLAVATLVLLVWQQRLTEPNVPVRRFAIELPWHAVPNWIDFITALSPQGTHIAYNGRVHNQVDVYVRALDSLEAQPLADARGPARSSISSSSFTLGSSVRTCPDLLR